jgi:hypothetical protein
MEGWWFNIINIKRTLRKRSWIQKHRLIGDMEIFKKMYWGFGKFLLLKDYLKLITI